LKVNRFFLEQLAYVARKLDGIREGERTLLDNSMVLFCSSMLTGSHDASQLPVLLLGGGGGRIQGGRILDYREKPERQMCRLYLSLMDKMNVRLPKFGDAMTPLEEV
ncbi:MAG TPA: hypothetical protein VNM37_08520, partial [Candidatus Dormibacteraeota bacterium]|nr:hypothetical protein [Candidatus Dormibacteraeota bacterium]